MSATLCGTTVKGKSCRALNYFSVLIPDSGEVQNFVGIHPTHSGVDGVQSRIAAEVKESMLQEFSHFHPDILKIFRFAVFDTG